MGVGVSDGLGDEDPFVRCRHWFRTDTRSSRPHLIHELKTKVTVHYSIVDDPQVAVD